jgi:hypothetical protein
VSPAIRARKRPRKRSWTFHRFAWLLTREAVLRICYPLAVFTPADEQCRRHLLTRDVDKLVWLANAVLRMHPRRRYWTPPAE